MVRHKSVKEMMDDPRLIWIDHHKSAMEQFSTAIRGYRIDGVAACRLAYQYFFTYNCVRNSMAEPDKTLPTKQEFIDRKVQEPMAVRLAGEYDIWDKRDPNAEIMQHGLRSLDLTNHWAQLLSLTQKPTIKEIEAMMDMGHQIDVQPDGTVFPPIIYTLLANGKVLQYARSKENESVIKHRGFTVEWEGLCFLCCNASRFNSHLFTAGLTPIHDACLGFNFDGNKWRVSLYGAPGRHEIDLSKIAVKYGGGGHKQACGFEVRVESADKLPFVPVIKS